MRSRIAIVSGFFAALLSIAVVLGAVTTTVQAWQWSASGSYFYNYPFNPNPVNISVIQYGITGTGMGAGTGGYAWDTYYGCPNQCATKADFVNFILNYKLNGARSYDPALDKIGAEFLISAMLNAPEKSGGGHNVPSQTDITNWQNMMNQPNISMDIEQVTFTLHTGLAPFSSGYDVQKWTDAVAQTNYALVFRDTTTGNAFMQIDLHCGNIAGTPSAPPSAAMWNLSGQASVSSATALPGATVHYKYTLTNSGTGAANNIGWSSYQGGTKKSSGTVSVSAGATTGSLPNATGEAFTIPSTAQAGTQYCRYIAYPDSQANPTIVHSNQACVTVLSNYDVYPNITGWAGGAPQMLLSGATTTISGFSAVNKGNNADDPSNYEIDRFVVPSAAAKPAFSTTFTSTASNVTAFTIAGYTGTNACTGWLQPKFGASVITGCTQVTTGTQKFNGGTTALAGSVTIDATNYHAGDWICVMVTVGDFYNYNVTDATKHRVTYPECRVIGKQPGIQLWGDDVHVGDNMSGTFVSNNAAVFTSHFNAQNSLGANATFGSWAEYGIFAPARIASISGGAVSGQNGYAPAQIPGPTANQLSFANTGVTAGYPYGNWSAAQQIPSVEAFAQQYPLTAAVGASTVDVGTLGSLGVGSNATNRIMQVPLSAVSTNISGTFTANGVAIVESKGDVTITGDIHLSQASISGLGSAQQLIIIARNIIISGSVKHIDAWLVARPTTSLVTDTNGRITTCDSFGSPAYYSGLTLSTCTNPLQINGALIAREVQFRRTFGADKTTGYQTPAETVNLRADAYMWAQAPTAGGASGLPIATTFTTELPPRY